MRKFLIAAILNPSLKSRFLQEFSKLSFYIYGRKWRTVSSTVEETVRHSLLECPALVGLQDELFRTCARKNWAFDLRTNPAA